MQRMRHGFGTCPRFPDQEAGTEVRRNVSNLRPQPSDRGTCAVEDRGRIARYFHGTSLRGPECKYAMPEELSEGYSKAYRSQLPRSQKEKRTASCPLFSITERCPSF
jgi:hypothetical protein